MHIFISFNIANVRGMEYGSLTIMGHVLEWGIPLQEMAIWDNCKSGLAKVCTLLSASCLVFTLFQLLLIIKIFNHK